LIGNEWLCPFNESCRPPFRRCRGGWSGVCLRRRAMRVGMFLFLPCEGAKSLAEQTSEFSFAISKIC
jgi:hypothetical protein